MENTSGGRKVNIQNDMPPKNKIKKKEGNKNGK